MKKIFAIIALSLITITAVQAQPAKGQSGEKERIVEISTSYGKMKIKLYNQTPKHRDNFIKLASEGFYNDLLFHRVINGFMIQGGDPTGTGRGGESFWGKRFNDEIVKELVFDSEGILAMANAGPNTNGSQFFITLAPTKWLNGNHTIFGKVINGMDVVRAIGKVAKGPQDRPLKDVVMESVTIETR